MQQPSPPKIMNITEFMDDVTEFMHDLSDAFVFEFKYGFAIPN